MLLRQGPVSIFSANGCFSFSSVSTKNNRISFKFPARSITEVVKVQALLALCVSCFSCQIRVSVVSTICV